MRVFTGVLSIVAALAAAGLAGCVLDPGQKHECRRDDDCVAGRLCVAGTCTAPPPGPADAGDGSAAEVSDAGPDGAAHDVEARGDLGADMRSDLGAEMPSDLGADAASELGVDAPSDVGDASDAVPKSDGSAAEASPKDGPAGDVPHEVGGQDAGAGSDGAPDAFDGGSTSDASDGPQPFVWPASLYKATGTPNIMFVTSGRHDADMGTLGTADGYCQEAAWSVGLPGNYRAWISTSKVNAKDRLKGARGWIRPDGAPFADTVEDIVAGRILYAPLIDEGGRSVLGAAKWFFFEPQPVMTGTNPDGTAAGTCTDWTSRDPMDKPTFGRAAGGTMVWTAVQGDTNCGIPMHLYCFGVDRNTPLSVVPVPGRKAFVSSALFVGSGLDSADRLCAGEATAAGATGSFAAALATSTASAGARFPTHDRPWVRLDGVALNAPGQDLFRDGPLMAPLDLTSKKEYGWLWVLTGSTTGNLRAPNVISSCNDWQDSGQTQTLGIVGNAAGIDDWFDMMEAPDACHRFDHHVYCLEK